jgi:hypothetical protein
MHNTAEKTAVVRTPDIDTLLTDPNIVRFRAPLVTKLLT